MSHLAQFFSNDRSKRALGNHSTRLRGGKLKLSPWLSFTYLVFVITHKHIFCKILPGVNFTNLAQNLVFWQILRGQVAFFRVNTKGWRFQCERITPLSCLSCWYAMFYRGYVMFILSSMFIMLIFCVHRVVQSYLYWATLRMKTFLGSKSGMMLLISW